MIDCAILGAGIAGISASYHLRASGLNAVVFEASDRPGGLVSNFSPYHGFRFDNAIHLSFTKSDYVRALFDQTPFLSHKPDAYCLEHGIWLKHPVQNNLAPLPTERKVELVESFINRPDKAPLNYEDWLYHQYGYEISNAYPIPYTRKYWGVEARELSLDWIGNRIRRAELSEILAGAMEQKDLNHYYASEMRYPETGGYYEFIRKTAECQDIRTGKRVISIDEKAKLVRFSDGSEEKYRRLISSLPLPIIVELLDHCPPSIVAAGCSLLWTTVDLISIGIKKESVPPHLWFYIYDENNLAARAHSPSIKSPNNAPKGCSSLQFEIYNLSSKDRLARDVLVNNIRNRLLEMNICSPDQILFIDHRHLPFGNVVFNHGMESKRQEVLDYLSNLGIASCGRFGEWEYFWSDQSFLSGKAAAERVIGVTSGS